MDMNEWMNEYEHNVMNEIKWITMHSSNNKARGMDFYREPLILDIQIGLPKDGREDTSLEVNRPLKYSQKT